MIWQAGQRQSAGPRDDDRRGRRQRIRIVVRVPGRTTGSFERNSSRWLNQRQVLGRRRDALGTARVVAVDLGASAAGLRRRVRPGAFRIWSGPPVLNGAIGQVDTSTRDVLGLHRGILDGIRAAGRRGHVDSFGSTPGVSTMACSTLMGRFSADPVHYRATAPAPSSNRS